MKLTLCRLTCVAASITVVLSAQAGETLRAQGPLGVQGIPAAADASASAAAPTLAFHVMPIYPQIAQAARVTGVVILEATVGIDGQVTRVLILRSIPVIDQAAIDAVRQWRFTPSSDKPDRIVVTVHFSLNDPTLYPRPATYSQPLPSWIPANFAFVYTYGCRQTTVEIDSIARSVTNMKGRPAERRFSFGFEGEQAAEVFVALVGAGFYEPSREGRRTWQEVAPGEPSIQQSGDQIVVRVVAQIPVVDVQNTGHQWFGGDQPPRQFVHTLKVRGADRWTEVYWYEPLDTRRSEHDKTLIAAGKRIRALVKANLTETGLQPACL